AERLVLASRSPQRRAILEQLGIPFTVRVSGAVEEDAGSPRAVAGENALRKALAGRAGPGEIVLGVDTLVATGAEIWGKPPDEESARETLRRLAGRTHEVVSGVAIVTEDGSVQAATAVTRVTFRALADEAVEWYLMTGEWRERAGGYAIQGRGAMLVERIEGDYLNVVGLPVATLVDLRPSLLPMRR
ncbi:MAG: nucleoside triphosphate pyrophosphatase, partial [Solirubrobacteraceae bacterium]|nr:nucleoside triphosphate pyrophosphatase [Solirubrobacteraceae bacterium]